MDCLSKTLGQLPKPNLAPFTPTQSRHIEHYGCLIWTPLIVISPWKPQWLDDTNSPLLIVMHSRFIYHVTAPPAVFRLDGPEI